MLGSHLLHLRADTNYGKFSKEYDFDNFSNASAGLYNDIGPQYCIFSIFVPESR